MEADLDPVIHFARTGELPTAQHPASSVLLTLARAVSPSPAEVSAEAVSRCRTAELSSAGIVELVTWIAVLQMLHRLSGFAIDRR